MKKEKPILFSTEMVKAILEGRKTQTRRIIKPQPNKSVTDIISLGNNFVSAYPNRMAFKPFEFSIKAKYQKGNILWVRETFLKLDNNFGYKALLTKEEAKRYKWKPSIFMPKEACRLFLEVINVDVERIQDISDTNSLNEGIEILLPNLKPYEDYCPYDEFRSLWIKINGEKSWNDNNWVWKIEFKIYNKI